MSPLAPREGKGKEKKEEKKPYILNILQGKYKEKTPVVASILLFVFLVIFLLPFPIHPLFEAVIKIPIGILEIILARDVLIMYGKKEKKSRK